MLFVSLIALCALRSDAPSGVPDIARLLGVQLGTATIRDLERHLGPPQYYEASTLCYWWRYPKSNPKRPNVHIDTNSDDWVVRVTHDSQGTLLPVRKRLLSTVIFTDWKGRLGDCNPLSQLPKCAVGKLAEGMSIDEVRKTLAPLKFSLQKPIRGNPGQLYESDDAVRRVTVDGHPMWCACSMLLTVYRGHLTRIELDADGRPISP